jgi:hypothetical protein
MTKSITMRPNESANGDVGQGLLTGGNTYTVSDPLAAELVNRRKADYATAIPQTTPLAAVITGAQVAAGATFVLAEDASGNVKNADGSSFTGGTGGISRIDAATDYNTATLPTEVNQMNAIAAAIPTQALQIHAVPISAGSWDASTNTPTISSGTAPTDGIQCRTVSVAGTTSVDGQAVWKVGDTITWNGTAWYRTATFPRSSGATGLVTTDSSGNPSTLAGTSATTVLGVASDGTPQLLTIGKDVGAPIFFVSTQPFGIAPGSSIVGASGAAFTAGTAFLETYGPTGAIPYDGIWLYFTAGAIDTGSAAGFYWVVMTSTTAGTIYNNFLSPGNSGLNKPPTTPTAFTTNSGNGATTGTTLQTLGLLITLAAGTLGANGTFEIEQSLRSNSSAGSKSFQTKFGGSNFGFGATSSTTSTVVDATMRAFNANNASRQRAVLKSTTGTPSLTAAPANGAVNTANATTIGLDLKLGTATDWVVCQYISIKIWPAA